MSQFIENFEFCELNLNTPSNDFDDLCYDDTASCTKIPAGEYLPLGKYAIYDQSQDNVVAGYTDEEQGLCKNYPAVLFGDHSRVIKYIDEPFFIGADGVKIIRPKTEDILPEFLFYDLKYHNIPNTGYNRHFKYIKMLKLTKATMDEQNKFLTFAHQADKSEFGDSKSQFIEMIGSKDWPQVRLKDIVHEECSISYGIVQPGDDIEEGVPIVRPVDMNDTHLIDKNTLKRTSRQISDSYSRTILRGDEILVCVRGTTGLIALANGLKGCNVTRGITPLYFKPQYNREYLFRAFLGEKVQKYIQENTIGSTLKGINMSKLREMPICMPPTDIQNQYVSIANQADKSEYELRSKIDAIDNDIKSFINANMKRIEYRYTLGKNTFIIMDGSICKENPIFV